MQTLPVVVIGAGPVGLSAGLALARQGQEVFQRLLLKL